MTNLSAQKLSSNSQSDFFRTDPVRSSAQRTYVDPIFTSPESRKETTQQVAKLAARLNASAVSEAEHRALLAERQKLLDKQLAGTMTRKETIRLQYVRWSLDRIEDAKHGLALDKLEGHISEIERLAEHLEALQQELSRAANRRR